ncbi:P-loop NTPase fold protein [Exiguobacterium sp. s37]|uniref:P-loop NTPase fold protein n=1 Tax=Exiguobacterium sp. s37 TaxID=2751275 RepID=UPI001BECA357|nr:P-loop NTPase fold protein [Exiguobacterium sp. s37]
MKANEIIKILTSLNNYNTYNKIFISGTWGIGKSKYISDFIADFEHVSYISMFGKKSTREVVEELYFDILENEKYGKFKSRAMKFRKSIPTASLGGATIPFSVSIPLMKDIHNFLDKKLSSKENFFIIIDDLERKHDDLSLKEVLGLIEKISQFKNIKIVLVADESNFSENDKELFEKFHEKTLDRIYRITAYADEAPINILTTPVWDAIKSIEELQSAKNLRTFIKIKNFISEVLEHFETLKIKFTDNFTINDVYRICSGIVIFSTDLEKSMPKVETLKKENPIINHQYEQNKSGYILYIDSYIIGQFLDSSLSKKMIAPLYDFFETGEWKDIITEIVQSINSLKKSPINFFSSEQELHRLIEDSVAGVHNFKSGNDLRALLMNVTTALQWTTILEVDYPINKEDLMEVIYTDLYSQVDIDRQLEENKFDSFLYGDSSGLVRDLILFLNSKIEDIYAEKVFKKLSELISLKDYQWQYVLALNEILLTSKDNLAYYIEIKQNNFYFPVPREAISESQWRWCKSIKNVISRTETISEFDLWNEFYEYITHLIESEESALTKHRLNLILNNK